MDIDAQVTDAQRRVLIRNLFHEDEELREEARREFKKAWEYDQPSFKVAELSSHSAETASLMAAMREGSREVVAWILSL